MFRLRFGYLFLAVGLAIVKWPLLPKAHELPFYEGITLCLLTAMSLLALLGLRYPMKLLPLLLFEALWKLIWFAVVALPRALAGDLDALPDQAIFNCSLVIVILATIPWRATWREYVHNPHPAAERAQSVRPV
jgi:hypothetical protein